MGLSPEQMAAVTLGEFEQMAERFGAALRVLRDAQSLFAPVGAPAPVVEIGPPTSLTPQNPMPPTPVQWSPAELAEKERMRRQRLAEMPENIRRLEET